MSDSEKDDEILVEVDKVYEMLNDLTSKEPDKVPKAENDIDAYLEAKKKSKVRVKASRTVINKSKSDEEEKEIAKKLAEEFRLSGNECFVNEDFERAVEFYTSGILQSKSCPLLFSNRAQARIRTGDFDGAIADCREAIKLKPSLIKARVHLAKALRGVGDYKQALSVLEEAESASDEAFEAIKPYKAEILADWKKFMLENAKGLENNE